MLEFRPPGVQRQQLENQIGMLTNARSLYLDRQAEAASRQMQQQMMNTPASPELASAIGTPQLAGTVIPPAYLPVISNENRGREAAQIAAQQRQDQLDQNKITLPPTVITKAAASAGGYPELEGKSLTTAQDYATFEKLSQARGLQKFDTGRDGQGQGRGIWILDRAGNPVQQISAISEANRATKLATMGAGQVYALPPGATNPVLTTMGAAQANGMQIVRPATAADNEKTIAAHDKAYVQPAEQVEKSYQMMNQAYNEYQGAAAQGKDLPTGAQSNANTEGELSTGGLQLSPNDEKREPARQRAE
jgi:hypothetical protein